MPVIVRALILVALQAFGGALFAQDPPPSADGLPTKALITGVPYVGWSEAAQVDYPDKDVLNPAPIAVAMMQQKFWGLEPTRFKLFGPRVFVPREWQTDHGGQGQGLDDLKRVVARGIPVYVMLTLTPYAHPASVSARLDMALLRWGKVRDARGGVGLSLAQVKELIALADHPDTGGGRTSGLLGSFATLETLRTLGVSRGSSRYRDGVVRSNEYLHLRESLYASPRLLIGYDDERRVMVVHDPSFGPALEIGYDDFELMWRYTGRWYDASTPDGHQSLLAKRPSSPPYPARTPDMRAAQLVVTGYALAQIGRTAEATAAFETGLALADIGVGYRFLLAYELAHLDAVEHRDDAAIAALRSATDAIPQAEEAWKMLAKLYRQNPSLPDADRLADQADAKSKARAVTPGPSSSRPCRATSGSKGSRASAAWAGTSCGEAFGIGTARTDRNPQARLG